MDMKIASTIGYERRHQELLAIEDEDEFVTRTTTSLGPQPPNFENIVALNQGPLRKDIAVAPALAPGQLAHHLRDGRWSSMFGPSCSSTRRTFPARSA
jgi:hydroxyacylglutathione hydrolase